MKTVCQLLVLPFLLLQNVIVWGQDTSSPSPKEFGIQSMELYLDNDVFFGNTDEDYTTGLRFKTTLESFRFSIPFLFGFANESSRKAKDETIFSKTIIDNFQLIELGLNYFTPEKIDTTEILYTERPYASNQYVGIGRTSVKKKYNASFLNESTYQRITTQLNFGLTGGPAAANLQRAFHHLANFTTPKGWHNQIGGTRNLVYVNYLLAYELLIGGTNIKTISSGYSNPAYGVLNCYQGSNILFQTSLNVGNMMNDVSFGVQWNFLNFNKHNEYYLKFYEGKPDLFPHNNSHFIRSRNTIRVAELKNEITSKYPSFVQGLQDTTLNMIFSEIVKPYTRGQLTVFRNDIIAAEIKLLAQNTLTQPQLDTLAVLNLILQMSDTELSEYSNLYSHEHNYINPYWDFKMFLKPEFKFVAHNGNLQGPLLYNTDSDYTIRYINPLLFSASLGAEYRFNSIGIRISYHIRSREVPAQCNEHLIFDISECNPDHILDLKKWHSWGNISIICYPSMILKRNEQKAYKKRMRI